MSRITSGHIVSVFSSDIEKIPLVITYIANGIASTYALVVSSILVGFLYGVGPALACFIPTTVMVLVQSILAIYQGSLRRDIAEKSDDRIFFMNEILSGIETIKMQVWEKFFEKRIALLRKSEMFKYLQSFLYKIAYRIISMIGMRFPLLIVILVYKTFSSETISQASLIRLIALLMLFERDILYYFPELMFMLKELLKSLRRIEVRIKIF